MNILFVSYEWPNVTDCGGSGRINKQLRDRLERRGHRVELFTDHTGGHFATFPLRHYTGLSRAIRIQNPDVVFACNTLPTAAVLPRLCRRHDVPLVTKTMGSDVHNPNRFTRIRPVLDRVNDYIFSRAAAVVSPSQALAGHIPDSHDVTVIPNGIAADDWTWLSHGRHDPFRVVTVARIQPIKQVGMAIEAVRELRRRGNGAVYRIVGDGAERERLEQEYGGLEWVEFVGWADNTQQHYHWADVFLLSSSHESFGLVLLEAIASGTPVVSTDTGGQLTVLSQSPRPGVLCPPSAESLATGLETVAANFQQYQNATQGYCENFTLESMTNEYDALFNSVLETTNDLGQTRSESSQQRQQSRQPGKTTPSR